MTVFLTSIGDWKTSRKGGQYKLCIFKNVDSSDKKSYSLYVYNEHSLSKRFIPFLEQGNIFENIDLFSEKYISGTSDFKMIGNVNKRNKV